MRAVCGVTQTLLPGDYCDVDGIEVECRRCGHVEDVYGTSEPSIKRGLVMLRENCPRGENNFYIAEVMLCGTYPPGWCWWAHSDSA